MKTPSEREVQGAFRVAEKSQAAGRAGLSPLCRSLRIRRSVRLEASTQAQAMTVSMSRQRSRGMSPPMRSMEMSMSSSTAQVMTKLNNM